MECIYNSDYLIYSSGLVWSKKRNQYLKGYQNGLGYDLVDIGNKKHQKIHRLVAEHYIPNTNNLPFVDHMNLVRTYNDVSNLRWSGMIDNNNNKSNITQTEKMQKAFPHFVELFDLRYQPKSDSQIKSWKVCLDRCVRIDKYNLN